MKSKKNKNISIGWNAFGSETTGSNSGAFGAKALVGLKGHSNVLIGREAGLMLTTESNIVIIGDYIHDLDRSQKDVLFIADNVAIGKTIFGKPLNFLDLKNDIIKHVKEYTNSRNK